MFLRNCALMQKCFKIILSMSFSGSLVVLSLVRRDFCQTEAFVVCSFPSVNSVVFVAADTRSAERAASTWRTWATWWRTRRRRSAGTAAPSRSCSCSWRRSTTCSESEHSRRLETAETADWDHQYMIINTCQLISSGTQQTDATEAPLKLQISALFSQQSSRLWE